MWLRGSICAGSLHCDLQLAFTSPALPDRGIWLSGHQHGDLNAIVVAARCIRCRTMSKVTTLAGEALPPTVRELPLPGRVAVVDTDGSARCAMQGNGGAT